MHLYVLCFGLGVMVGVAGLITLAALFLVFFWAADNEEKPRVIERDWLKIPSTIHRDTDLTLH